MPQAYDHSRGYRVTTHSCSYNIDYDLEKMEMKTNVKPLSKSESDIEDAVEKANKILKSFGLADYYEYV